MTAAELIRLLLDVDPDAEIRLMTQPSWPFEYSIGGTWQPEPLQTLGTCMFDLAGLDAPYQPCGGQVELSNDEWRHFNAALDAKHEPEVEDADEAFRPDGDPASVVYLTEGTQLAYGTKAAWE